MARFWAVLIHVAKGLHWGNKMKTNALKQQILAATLPHVPFDGWTDAALHQGLKDAGLSPTDLLRAFPEGASDCMDFFMDELDREMHQAYSQLYTEPMKLGEKVEAAILLRLKATRPFREAYRKALAHLSLPFNAARGAKRLYGSVDAIWRMIGDHPTDFSFYTKRLSLAGIYSTTVLFWLDDESNDEAETKAFLKRRMGDLFQFHRLKKQCTEFFSKAKSA